MEQLDSLLFLQRFRQVLEVTETIVGCGCCDRRAIADHVVRFLPRTETASLIAREHVWSIVGEEL